MKHYTIKKDMKTRTGKPKVTFARSLCILLSMLAFHSGIVLAQINPILPGWYADPEIRYFNGRYWIYPTVSTAPENAPEPKLSKLQQSLRENKQFYKGFGFLDHTYFDAFSSHDLITWTKHPRVMTVESISWASYALWAPSAIEANGKYYLFFGANDLQQGDKLGGIGVAVSDKPEGPFHDLLGKPLIGEFHNGAQPIDQMAFRDDDGQYYLYYGGHKNLNVVRLKPDMTGLDPFADGIVYKDITPRGYVEGPFMLKRKGIYYLMWSEGEWASSNYQVAYATAPTALGPFTKRGVILKEDLRIARGAGHHSVIREQGTDRWWIAYHRRPLNELIPGHRQVALDRLEFAPDGSIKPVIMTSPNPLSADTPVAAAYSTNTTLGDLLDSTATRAVLDKHIPELVANPQIASARGLSLRQIQLMSPGVLSDEILEKIDHDLAEVSAPTQ